MKTAYRSIDAEGRRLLVSARKEVWRYGVAVGAVGLAILARLSLHHVLGGGAFIMFFPAVALAAMAAGGRSGLAATALSAVAANWLLFKPRGIWGFENIGEVVSLVLFVAAGLVISFMAAMLSRARVKEQRASEQIREKQAELELILNHTPFMLTRCSRDLRYRYASRAYGEMVGRSPQQIAGKAIVEIMGEKGFESIRSRVEAVLRGERVEYESGVEFNGVGLRQLNVRYVPDQDEKGEVIGWVASIVDMTERMQARQALQEREAQFRTLADSIPNLAWWANGDGHVTWYNRRWYEYTGTTSAQMEGWGWQSAHDPQVLPGVLEKWRACIATGEVFEMEVPLRGVDGRYRWFLTRVVPVRDAAGKVVRWFGTSTDTSAMREARLVLARSNEELESLVTERTAKLQELVEDLEHFSYTITHDMRAPLRAMRCFAEAIYDEVVDEKQRELLGRIITAAARMDALIADALNYSKAVREELPLVPIDAGKLLQGMLDTYPEFQSSHSHIKVERDIPLVMGNEAGLTQCLSNLLGNALKFAKEGTSAEVRVWSEKRDRWVRLWVEDNGIGIPEPMLPRLFGLFSRGAGPQAGTGVGLALVRKVVARMGGRVGVESQIGKGSRFWVELKPADDRDVEHKTATAPEEEPNPGKNVEAP
jgi:PAS domain S-box-containing protein